MALYIVSDEDIMVGDSISTIYVPQRIKDKSINRITNLYIALAHGSVEHRLWLEGVIKNWFEGKPLPGIRQ